MSTESQAQPWTPALGLFGGLGRWTTAVLAYVGGLFTMLGSAMASATERPAGALSLRAATLRQLDWLLGMGVPIVGLVHVGMGSFLAMQAYFGATFDVGVGPVVGVGLVRNAAPLLTGFILAGLMAARTTSAFRQRAWQDLDADPDWLVDRDVAEGQAPDPRQVPSLGRLVLPRLLAGAIAGPALALWGSAVGIFIGCRVAQAILGIPVSVFFYSMFAMLWPRDVVGLVLKGLVFGGIAAALACFEGARADDGPLPTAACRAVCIGVALILAGNLSWFFFVYLSGPPFGPTVLPT